MGQKHDVQRIIRRPFSAKEWDALMNDPEFASAFERAESTEEAEELMTLGARLLDKTPKESGARKLRYDSKHGMR